MAGTHTATSNTEALGLADVFALAAMGTAASAMGMISAPVMLGFGAVAAIVGIGLLGRAASSDTHGNTNVALVASITAAVTSFVIGLPMEFISEALVFPWAHDTAFGAKTMEASGSLLVPIYDTIGSWFGIEPFGIPDPTMPVADI